MKKLLLLVNILVASISLSGQTNTSIILQNTDVEALQDLRTQWAVDAEAAYNLAVTKAKLYGWSIRKISADGKSIVVLDRLDENGNPVYLTTTNTAAAITTRTDRVHTGGGAGLNLSGTGFKIGLWEVGAHPRTTHEQYTGRVSLLNNTSSASDHATHVAGTLIGDGTGSASAKGMAPLATIDAFDTINDEVEMAAQGANGLLVSNHSYGVRTGWYFNQSSSMWEWSGGNANFNATGEDPYFGKYGSTTRQWDQIANNAPYYLIVKAAGNDRREGPDDGDTVLEDETNITYTYDSSLHPSFDGNFDCIINAGNAKNILTVAAVNDVANYVDETSVSVASFSGFGPTDDGRIKPDISANGVAVRSSLSSSNTAYGSASGTSMATPNAAGSAILLQEHYENTHGSGNFMWSSSLKAVIIHSADEAGKDGPDYRYGWGLMNTETAAKIISDDVLESNILTENNLSDAGTYTISFEADLVNPVIATIVWNDPAGASSNSTVVDDATLKLVNDLDLRITHSGTTTTHTPYILNPSSPGQLATTGDNFRDNVEQIFIDTPQAGTYTLTVNHKNSLVGGSQNFSLIITGAASCPIDKVLTNTFNDYQDIEVSNTITASNLIDVGADVTYDAANFIQLDPGFTVTGGAQFHAFIDGCGNL